MKRPPFIPVKQKAAKPAPKSAPKPAVKSAPQPAPKPAPKPARDAAAPYDVWAVAAPGIEPLLEAELRTLGFADAAASTGGVRFTANSHGLALANLQSRLASRIVVRIAEFKALAFHELERAARKVEWSRMLAPGATFRLRVTAKKSRLYHSDAIAERVADAICRSVSGARRVDGPAKDEDELDERGDHSGPHTVGVAPDAASAQLFVVRFDHDRCTVSADASGELLHRRGYRQAVAKAPLRETLAAAVLAAVRYDPAKPLVDPFCGSGTILIEAAMMARRIAPGSKRSFAAERWPEMGAAPWREVREAAARAELPKAVSVIVGSDRDAGAIEAALSNAERAGVLDDLVLVQRPLSALVLLEPAGLLATNPPYGTRLSERAPLRDLYARLGQVLRESGAGWRVGMISADRQLEGHSGLRFAERVRTSNGGIPVRIIEAQVM